MIWTFDVCDCGDTYCQQSVVVHLQDMLDAWMTTLEFVHKNPTKASQALANAKAFADHVYRAHDYLRIVLAPFLQGNRYDLHIVFHP